MRLTVLRAAAARRIRDDRGYVGIQIIALMILLSTLTALLFTATTTSVKNAEKSRSLVEAREALDSAAAVATHRLATTGPTGITEAAPVAVTGLPAHMSASYWFTPQTVSAAGGNTTVYTYHATATANGVTQTSTRPVRAHMVQSVSTEADGSLAYQVGTAALWTNAVSSTDDSRIKGEVSGNWGIYGASTLTVNDTTGDLSVIGHNAKAAIDGPSHLAVSDSTLIAGYDTSQIDDYAAECAAAGTPAKAWVASQHAGVLSAAAGECFSSMLFDVATRVIGSPEFHVSGRVIFEAPVTASLESRIYTSTIEAVHFKAGATTIENAFIFAPYAVCSTAPAANVTFTGSLACRAVKVTGSFARTKNPLRASGDAWTRVNRPISLYFLEPAGFVDTTSKELHP